MPTIPLYNTSAIAPGAWRHVIAPGGFQWWRLDAVDRSAGTILGAGFFDGRWHDAKYQHRFNRFMRSPTRIDPPLPAEYRAVELDFHADGNASFHEVVEVDAADFEASADEMRVRIGEYLLQPAEGDQFVMSGPDMKVTLTPAGIDGSLWHVTATLPNGRRFDGRGVLHSEFDVKPPRGRLGYRILLPERAVVGESEIASGQTYPERFVAGGMELRDPRLLREASHRAVVKYAVESEPGAIAIVEVV